MKLVYKFSKRSINQMPLPANYEYKKLFNYNIFNTTYGDCITLCDNIFGKI